jgi:flavodoxin
MKALVAYDSTWGNTEKIAKGIAAGILGGTKAVRVRSTEDNGYVAVRMAQIS